MRLARWVVAHGRTDWWGYRQVVSTHWTRFGAASAAALYTDVAREQGLHQQTYWAERRRPEDHPGRCTVHGEAPRGWEGLVP